MERFQPVRQQVGLLCRESVLAGCSATVQPRKPIWWTTTQ